MLYRIPLSHIYTTSYKVSYQDCIVYIAIAQSCRQKGGRSKPYYVYSYNYYRTDSKGSNYI